MSGEQQMKVLTLMNYIRQICAMKRTSITNLREQEWVMYLDELDVDERNIRRSAGACETGEEILLEIAYPVPATCPPLPESLNGWIATPQWEDLQVEEVETRPKLSKNRQQILRFHDSEQRVRDFAEWRAARTSWYNNEHAKKKPGRFLGSSIWLMSAIVATRRNWNSSWETVSCPGIPRRSRAFVIPFSSRECGCGIGMAFFKCWIRGRR